MKKAPSPLVSLIPIVVLVLLLFATIRTFGSDALSGGSQVSLLTTTAICILIGMVFYKIPWKDYELAITNNIAGVATAIIILLIIGALSGIWMISGVVPTLIYYGMNLLRDANYPSQFLPGIDLHHLRVDFCNDRKFVDHYCHYRYCIDGYRKGARL